MSKKKASERPNKPADDELPEDAANEGIEDEDDLDDDDEDDEDDEDEDEDE